MAIQFLRNYHFYLSLLGLKYYLVGRMLVRQKGCVTALPMLANTKKLLILCLRELQNSIKESTYENLKNRIYDIELDSEFEFSKTLLLMD